MPKTIASKLALNFAAVFALACAPSLVFAQHGGGHGGGGGGFHGGGGGGFHGGGGFGGGAAVRSTPGPSGGGSPRSGVSVSHGPGYNPSRPSVGNSAPNGNTNGNNGFRPGPNGAPNTSASAAAPATHDGQWHFFGQPATAAGAGNSLAAGASRVVPSTGTAVRSFAGQGNQIYEEAPHSVASASRAAPSRALTGSNMLTARVNGLPSTAAGTAGLSTSSAAFGRFGTFGGSRFFPRFGGGFGLGFRSRRFFGSPFFGFGFGGFGYGFGFSPCLGFGWDYDPFCNDFYAPWPAYGYLGPGSYGYGPDYYPPSVDYGPNYDPNYSPYYPPAPGPYGDSSVNAPEEGNPANAPGSVILYLKDGTSLSPTDYWITGGQLHYILGGTESVIPLDQVDLPRSNDENQKRGIRFWLKSAPAPQQNSAPPSPQQDSAPPASPQGRAPDSQPVPSLALSSQGI
jgi:hypothetical protein